MNSATTTGIAVVLSALVTWGAISYFRPAPPPQEVGQTVVATKAKETATEPTIDRPIKRIKTYRSATKKKLKLPEAVQANEQEQVIASSKVKSDLHPHTITTVVNTETGEVQTFDRKDPLPLLGFQQHLSAYVDYGAKYRSSVKQWGMAGAAGLQYEAVQTKNLKWRLKGQIDTDGDAFVGGQVSIDFW